MRQFLAVSYLTLTNELCQLCSHWTEFHEIFTRYRRIIYAVNAHIEVAISHSFSKCQSDERGEFAIFFTKLVAMATSVDISEKEVLVDSAPKTLSFGEKIAKIGPAYREIFD